MCIKKKNLNGIESHYNNTLRDILIIMKYKIENIYRLSHRISQGPRLQQFRKYGDHFGRAVRKKQGGAQTARAPRAHSSARRAIRRADRYITWYPVRAENHGRRAVLPPHHWPNAHRAVRVRHVHQLSADGTALTDHHQQGQDMPLLAVMTDVTFNILYNILRRRCNIDPYQLYASLT